jgi:hypothetical protein
MKSISKQRNALPPSDPRLMSGHTDEHLLTVQIGRYKSTKKASVHEWLYFKRVFSEYSQRRLESERLLLINSKKPISERDHFRDRILKIRHLVHISYMYVRIARPRKILFNFFLFSVCMAIIFRRIQL